MLEEVYENILRKSKFEKEVTFEKLIRSTITKAWSDENEPDDRYFTVSFKLQKFFDGFTGLQNQYGKDKKYQAGAEALFNILEELQVDVDESECFILYHLRDMGKFRKKEADLLKELKALWGNFPVYAMEDRPFSKTLKSLMRNKLIQYRKGNIHLNPSTLLRYKV